MPKKGGRLGQIEGLRGGGGGLGKKEGVVFLSGVDTPKHTVCSKLTIETLEKSVKYIQS